MQRISKFFKMLGSLGVFGIILLLTAILVSASLLASRAMSEPFDAAYEQMTKLFILGDEIIYYLQEIESNQAQFLLSQGDESYLPGLNQAVADMQEVLGSVQEDGIFYEEDEQALFDNIVVAFEQRQQTFQAMSSAMTAQDRAQMESLQSAYRSQSQSMMQQVQDLVFLVTTKHLAKQIRLNLSVVQAVKVSVACLILMPFLALWAFGESSRITQPILTLTNAVVAIEGNRFRPDLLADLAGRRDLLGRLAHDLEDLADTLSEREEILQQEVDDLREQLHETRRRRAIAR
jgi:hypothetical protein